MNRRLFLVTLGTGILLGNSANDNLENRIVAKSSSTNINPSLERTRNPLESYLYQGKLVIPMYATSISREGDNTNSFNVVNEMKGTVRGKIPILLATTHFEPLEFDSRRPIRYQMTCTINNTTFYLDPVKSESDPLGIKYMRGSFQDMDVLFEAVDPREYDCTTQYLLQANLKFSKK